MTWEIELDGGELRRLRQQLLDLDQIGFGKKLGVSQAAVSRWENGRTTTRETAEKIAAALGVPVGRILKQMPGDLRRDPDSPMRAWLQFIEGKTRELEEAVSAAGSPEELPVDMAFEIERLHRDIERYAGPELELDKGDSRISLALDDMKFAVDEAYKARFGSRTDPEKIMEQVIKEESETKVKNSA